MKRYIIRLDVARRSCRHHLSSPLEMTMLLCAEPWHDAEQQAQQHQQAAYAQQRSEYDSQSPHYPAEQSILKRHVDDAISPLGLLRAVLMPTMIVWLCFTLLGRSCTPCLSYKAGHLRPILIALKLSGA